VVFPFSPSTFKRPRARHPFSDGAAPTGRFSPLFHFFASTPDSFSFLSSKCPVSSYAAPPFSRSTRNKPVHYLVHEATPTSLWPDQRVNFLSLASLLFLDPLEFLVCCGPSSVIAPPANSGLHLFFPKKLPSLPPCGRLLNYSASPEDGTPLHCFLGRHFILDQRTLFLRQPLLPLFIPTQLMFFFFFPETCFDLANCHVCAPGKFPPSPSPHPFASSRVNPFLRIQ